MLELFYRYADKKSKGMETVSENGGQLLSGLSLKQADSFGKKNLEQQDFLRLIVSQIQMATSLQSNQALQASALIGRKVLVHSNNFKLDIRDSVKIAIDISPNLRMLSAFIYTNCGKLVKTMSLGQSEPGLMQFDWDGTGQDNLRLKAGYYRVEVRAVSDDKEILLKTMAVANVDSVSFSQNGEGLKLNVAGVGPVLLDQVRQISV